MKEFKDLNGNVWRLNMTIGAIEKVRDILGFDLLRPDKPQGEDEMNYYGRLDEDSLFDFKVIKILCEDSIKEFGYDETTLANLFGPKQLADAKKAFQAEYEDFFLESGRPEMAELLRAVDSLMKSEVVSYVDRLNALDLKSLADEVITTAMAEKAMEDTEVFGD